jgi:hypothetical protein
MGQLAKKKLLSQLPLGKGLRQDGTAHASLSLLNRLPEVKEEEGERAQ